VSSGELDCFLHCELGSITAIDRDQYAFVHERLDVQEKILALATIGAKE